MNDMQNDYKYLSNVASDTIEYDYEMVQAASKRIKKALYGSSLQEKLNIEDDFYNTALGQMIRMLECGPLKNEKQLTINQIAKLMGWSKTWVLKQIYNKDEENYSHKEIQGKIAATKTTNGYLVNEITFLEWKEKFDMG